MSLLFLPCSIAHSPQEGKPKNPPFPQIPICGDFQFSIFNFQMSIWEFRALRAPDLARRSRAEFLAIENCQLKIENPYKLAFAVLGEGGITPAKGMPDPKFVPKSGKLGIKFVPKSGKFRVKFVYSAVKKGGRGREFRSALDWLEDTGMIRRVFRINKAAEPLSAFAEQGSFKVYHLDVGLLACMAGVRPGVVLEGNRVYSEFFGALAEQFVLQELRAYMPGTPVYYWASGNVAEVEFVFCSDVGIVPVDVKGGRNLRAKSLSVFREKYAPPASVIVGKIPLAVDHGVLKMPFCYLWRLADAVAATRRAAG